MDLVIPLRGVTRNDHMDIRYLLRSFDQNYKQLGNVFIITEGGLSWAKNVIVLQYKDIFPNNKDANLISKVYRACTHKDISENFIRASDDQVMLKPMTDTDFKVWGYGSMRDEFMKNSPWKKRYIATREKLLSEGKPIYNYDVHMPMVINRDKFIEVALSYDWWINGGGYNINSLYFNNCVLEPQESAFKVKYACEGDVSFTELIRSVRGKFFIGYNTVARDVVHRMLKNMFPGKCRYEI